MRERVKEKQTAHRDSGAARRIEQEMICMSTTPAQVNCKPSPVARQDAEVSLDQAQLFVVPDRRAGYDAANIEAAEYILADPRRVRHSPLLELWAEAVMRRVRGKERQ